MNKLFASALAVGMALCASSVSAKDATVGAAAGGNSTSQDGALERCDQPFGTLALSEEQEADWYRYLTVDLRLPSTVPMLKLLIQQSNCFVVVERGRALDSAMNERALADSGELRSGSKMHKGQMVAADFTLNPTIRFAQTTGGVGAGIGGVLRGIGGRAGVAGALLGGVQRKESSSILTLIDNRSSVQIAAAEGSAKKFSFAIGGVIGAGGAGGYSSTPEGKLIAAGFGDAYNKMVIALRNYKPQEVKGGLGKGGTLPVGR